MKFTSTKGMTNDTAPKGQVLVQYLDSAFGYYSVEYAIGYYDNPNESPNGEGWKNWVTNNKINVLAYTKLPKTIKSQFTKIRQEEFLDKFGSFHPNLGSIGE